MMRSTQSEREPLLRRISSNLGAPPMLVQPGVEKLISTATMPEDSAFPAPKWVTRVEDKKQRKMPQCIAHRGYKAKHPENSMAAFKGAVKAGAHAIETDLHVTKDEVVVISHDATLKRCFGRPDKIKDKTWDEIKDLTTTSDPHEHMPRLLDLLAYLSEPGLEDIWILLDIKLDNDADQIMRLIASTIASAPPASKRKWEDRVVLGIWAAKFLPLALKYSPGFPVVHIGFSTSYARHFFQIPDVGFNMLLPILIGPGGQSFLREAREKFHRRVIAWTVNTEDRMEWCIRRELDGVITDDPEMFLRVCDGFDDTARESWPGMRWGSYWEVWRLWVWVTVAFWWFGKMFAPIASRSMIVKKVKT